MSQSSEPCSSLWSCSEPPKRKSKNGKGSRQPVLSEPECKMAIILVREACEHLKHSLLKSFRAKRVHIQLMHTHTHTHKCTLTFMHTHACGFYVIVQAPTQNLQGSMLLYRFFPLFSGKRAMSYDWFLPTSFKSC